MSDTTQPKYRIKEINQVCMVVKDLDRTVRNYWHTFGIGPWKLYTYDASLLKKGMTYQGKPAVYSMRIGLATVGNLSLELIQPLEGSSLYRDFLDQHGEGIHHVGFFVPKLDEATAALEQAGLKVTQSGGGHGIRGDGGFAYLDTEDDLAAIFEAIEIPSERVQPEATYP